MRHFEPRKTLVGNDCLLRGCFQFPTQVGVNRRGTCSKPAGPTIPHASGGEPPYCAANRGALVNPPRKWGIDELYEEALRLNSPRKWG